MKLPHIFFVGLLWISSNVLFAQPQKEAMFHIRKLSAPRMHGRSFVEKGADKAAHYIAKEFKKSGLIPIGSSYFQNFEMAVNTFPEKIRFKINGKKIRPAVDFLVHPSSGAAQGTYRVIGLENLTLNKTFLKNHWLVIDKAVWEKETAVWHRKIMRQKLAGVLLLTDEKLNWSVSQEQAPYAIVELRKGAIDAAIEEIEIDLKPVFEPQQSAKNVWGYLKGKESDSLIVFTAHYDHLGSMGKTLFPGANDNASGVALLLSLAKHFSRNPTQYSILFLAFGGEEAGLLGSKYFIEHTPFALSNIKFLLNFDIVGTGEDGATVVNASAFPDQFEHLKSLNKTHHFLKKLKSREPACNSDQCFFYEKGVPCFYLYTLGGNPAYHDPNDRVNTLSLDAFEGLRSLIIQFVAQL